MLLSFCTPALCLAYLEIGVSETGSLETLSSSRESANFRYRSLGTADSAPNKFTGERPSITLTHARPYGRHRRLVGVHKLTRPRHRQG